MHHNIYLFMHRIDCYFYIFFVLTCSLPLILLVSFWLFSVCLVLSLASCLGKLEPIGPPLPLLPTFDSDRFLSEKNQEAFKKLNLRRNIWAERKVLLDELDHEIRRNFERRGWLLYWIFLIHL